MAISTRITLEGADELRKQFEELGRASERAFREIGEQIRRLGEIELPTKAAQKSLSDLETTAKGTFKEIETAASETKVDIPVEKSKTSFQDLASVAKAAFGDVKEAANVATRQIENLTSGFSGLQKALLGLGAVGGVLAFIVNQ